MHKKFLKTTFLLLAGIVCSNPAGAQPEKEQTTLEMFYDQEDVVVTPTRYPKSISRVAENITIVTAEQIKAINAHTVADVLIYVPSLQVELFTGPGGYAQATIQNSNSRHVLVLIDGVSQNSLSEGTADIGAIPVQNIERIEIVKGPASSAWGSSLGGVINIITKSPDDQRRAGGAASASIGTRNTGDYRSEISGKIGALGYYLNGGGMVSDGVQPHNSFNGGNMYTKLQVAATEKADLTFSFGYNTAARDLLASDPLRFSSDSNYLFATVALNYIITKDIFMDFSLRTARRESHILVDNSFTGTRVDISGIDKEFGGTVKMTRAGKIHELTAGIEFDLGELESESIQDRSQRLDKWAIFFNDTMSLGAFSFIPGIRYDHTSANGDFWSPSIGATYTVAGNSILRGYVARGFGIPPLGFTFVNIIGNPHLKPENVWSYAMGFETSALRYMWLKTMFFRHDINEVLSGFVNEGKERREGMEVEVKTMPLFNFMLTGGYCLMSAKDRETGEGIPGIVTSTINVGLMYDNPRFLQGTLKGYFIRWKLDPSDNGKSDTMIWDLNLARRIFSDGYRNGEIFFAAHNLFNGAQYQTDIYKNPRRWFEGGLRFNF